MMVPETSGRQLLVLFGKPPIPGQVKTRLTPPLSERESADLYRAFVLDLCARKRPEEVETLLSLAPPVDESFPLSSVSSGLRVVLQEGPDLASRLATEFERQFARGAARVVVRNTDSPLLPEQREQDAFRLLRQGAEIVLGPDRGGGYYLVGMNQPFPRLFTGLPMSVPSNYAQTLLRARQLSRHVAVLPAEPDVDRIEDLLALARELQDDPDARRLAPRTAEAIRALRGSLGLPGSARE
ncbi:MAG: TIGR04282 family arsenosugar biosynthesis glycosyltransferase [Planctomycetota bacterium]